MRSRKLHRDEDMVEDALRSKVPLQYCTYDCIGLFVKLWLYSTSLMRHFKSHDTNNSGVIHNTYFKVSNIITP